jgi:hypothetical protein
VKLRSCRVGGRNSRETDATERGRGAEREWHVRQFVWHELGARIRGKVDALAGAGTMVVTIHRLLIRELCMEGRSHEEVGSGGSGGCT